MASLTIGMKLGVAGVVVCPGTLGKSWRIARRQPKTCCEQICQRRATSDTRAPGTRVSSTIRAFSSADQRRRRPGPVRISTRRYSPFASSLASNITVARCPLPPANQPRPGPGLNEGVGAALTFGCGNRRFLVFDGVGPKPAVDDGLVGREHVAAEAKPGVQKSLIA